MYAASVVWGAVAEEQVLLLPATAIALARAAIDPRDRPVLDVLLGLPEVVVDPLTGARALDVGRMLARRPQHLGVGHAAVCALERNWSVVTGEPGAYADLGVDLRPLP